MGKGLKKLFRVDPTRATLLTGMVSLTIIASAILIALLSYWLFYPYQTTSYSPAPFVLNKTTYKQGETAYYFVSYCKYTDQKPVIHRYFVDGLKIEAAENKVQFEQGCHVNQEVKFTIPKSLPPGRWHLTAVAVYKFNPLREEVINTHDTEWFNVIRDESGAYGDATNLKE